MVREWLAKMPNPDPFRIIGENTMRWLASTDAIERLIHYFLKQRQDGETFKQTYQRLGHDVMKEALYAAD
jgi:sulfite reductase beta subunit-like hemoprotein